MPEMSSRRPRGPIIRLHNAYLIKGEDKDGKSVEYFHGFAENHPTFGARQIQTSPIIEHDEESELYYTQNHIYKVCCKA